MSLGKILEIVFIWPISNLLIGFYKLFLFLHFPWALAFAIITLTVLVRLILWPLTKAQLVSAKKLAALKPHLDGLKQKHGHDKARLQQEQMKLYKEHGVNPAAGCLPLLLQMPIFIALYRVLIRVINSSNGGGGIEALNQGLLPFLKLNTTPQATLLGFNLAQSPTHLFSSTPAILLIPLITGGLQFIQSKMMTPQRQSNLASKETGGEKSDMEKTMEQVQGQMLFLMPAMFAFFAFSFPLGLSLYWNVFTVFGIIQQYSISGFGGLAEWLPVKKDK